MSAFSHAELATAMRQAVRSSLDEAPAFDPPPTLDLAVVAFPHCAPAVWANVLFTRQHPQGHVAEIGLDASAVRGIHYLADPTDEERRSIAWMPGSDWTTLTGLRTLHGHGPIRSIAPYPASLIKLLVAVGVGLLIDRGNTHWNERWAWSDTVRTVHDWCDRMLTESRNDATSALVALLHARGLIRREANGRESHNGLHEAFERHGLPTLRLAHTKADGGWLNRDGAGVGHLQMTAWDTVRLMWLMLPAVMPDVAPAPWRSADAAPLLQPATAAHLWSILDDQALHEGLSSSVTVGLPGWRAGLPALMPNRWLGPDGRARAADREWPADLRAASAPATVRFAHKTGTTENYLSDAGWVRSLQPGGRRYLVALLSTLGSRHAPHEPLATDWCIPALGARIDAWLAQRMG